MTITTLILLIVFQIKHLLADYYFQFPYMYQNKGKSKGWFWALYDHSGVHAIFTFLIICVYAAFVNPGLPAMAFSLVLFDFVTHFITDRWKATRDRAPQEPEFWYNLGIDQMVHHIVGIIIVYFLVIL